MQVFTQNNMEHLGASQPKHFFRKILDDFFFQAKLPIFKIGRKHSYCTPLHITQYLWMDI